MTLGTKSAEKTFDRFYWEKKLHAEGAKALAGIDEAGRGPLAGPVVAAAVALPSSWFDSELPETLSGINDSKRFLVHGLKKKKVFHSNSPKFKNKKTKRNYYF